METFDIAVIGSGPAGQKAAIQGAKAGRRVVLVERERRVGGACVHRGTIPSKTLREAALQIAQTRRVVRGADIELGADFAINNLMGRLASVLDHHENFWSDQLERNDIDLRIGTAYFSDEHTLLVRGESGSIEPLRFETAIIATGSRPRRPPEMNIDHDRILDSDSVLTLEKVPSSLIVLGAGVIAAEYASIFAALGVSVTMVDNRDRPVPFVDPELAERFVAAFHQAGGVYLPGQTISSLERTEDDRVELSLGSGGTLSAARALVALGRVANSDQLGLEEVGVSCRPRGTIQVDKNGWTGVASIYAVGDVIGGPSLASTSMDQGRRAVRAALGMRLGHAADLIPAGVYTIPEISCVGLSEQDARSRFGDAIVGRARFAEVARGCICGDRDGLVKLVVEPGSLRLVGVHIIGTSAAELVHVGQVGLIAGWTAIDFVDNVFNFPTFAEAYRIAALDVVKQARARDAHDHAAVNLVAS